MTQNTPISELDFFALKEQLKTYLRQQDQFRDYAFEGSNLSVLLDVLAYNTYQNNFYNNMAISEMFLDSAQRENSVVSHAKTLNYLPKSRRSARASISFDISAPNNPSFITIPRLTRFVARDDRGTTFTFHTDRAYSVVPDRNGVYAAKCIEIFEGIYVTETYQAQSNVDFRYQIANETVDVSSVRVTVTDQQTGVETEYAYTSNVFGVKARDRVFFVQSTFGNYEIYFGRDVFGRQPSAGDIISIEYRVTEGARANGAVRFSLSGTIDGNTISPIKVDGPSIGGTEKESIADIKFFAPRSIQVQERAVTESDYEILLKNQFPEIRAVSVIGGEKLVPPRYGHVAVHIDLRDGAGLSLNRIEQLERYLQQKVPLGIRPFVKKPNYMYFETVVDVVFDNTRTAQNEAAIASKVRRAILGFSESQLEDFGKPLRYSKLLSAIDSCDENIVSSHIRMRAVIEAVPSVTTANVFELDFGNELLPVADHALRSLQSQVPNHPRIPKLESERSDRYPAISSTPFVLRGTTVFVRDNGFGRLQVIRTTNDRDVIVSRDVGRVDYKTGKLNIAGLRIDSYRGVFKFYADTKIADVSVSKDKISRIRDEDVTVVTRSVSRE
jgi:hypothetical protein